MDLKGPHLYWTSWSGKCQNLFLENSILTPFPATNRAKLFFAKYLLSSSKLERSWRIYLPRLINGKSLPSLSLSPLAKKLNGAKASPNIKAWRLAMVVWQWLTVWLFEENCKLQIANCKLLQIKFKNTRQCSKKVWDKKICFNAKIFWKYKSSIFLASFASQGTSIVILLLG